MNNLNKWNLLFAGIASVIVGLFSGGIGGWLVGALLGLGISMGVNSLTVDKTTGLGALERNTYSSALGLDTGGNEPGQNGPATGVNKDDGKPKGALEKVYDETVDKAKSAALTVGGVSVGGLWATGALGKMWNLGAKTLNSFINTPTRWVTNAVGAAPKDIGIPTFAKGSSNQGFLTNIRNRMLPDFLVKADGTVGLNSSIGRSWFVNKDGIAQAKMAEGVINVLEKTGEAPNGRQLRILNNTIKNEAACNLLAKNPETLAKLESLAKGEKLKPAARTVMDNLKLVANANAAPNPASTATAGASATTAQPAQTPAAPQPTPAPTINMGTGNGPGMAGNSQAANTFNVQTAPAAGNPPAAQQPALAAASTPVTPADGSRTVLPATPPDRGAPPPAVTSGNRPPAPPAAPPVVEIPRQTIPDNFSRAGAAGNGLNRPNPGPDGMPEDHRAAWRARPAATPAAAPVNSPPATPPTAPAPATTITAKLQAPALTTNSGTPIEAPAIRAALPQSAASSLEPIAGSGAFMRNISPLMLAAGVAGVVHTDDPLKKTAYAGMTGVGAFNTISAFSPKFAMSSLGKAAARGFWPVAAVVGLTEVATAEEGQGVVAGTNFVGNLFSGGLFGNAGGAANANFERYGISAFTKGSLYSDTLGATTAGQLGAAIGEYKIYKEQSDKDLSPHVKDLQRYDAERDGTKPINMMAYGNMRYAYSSLLMKEMKEGQEKAEAAHPGSTALQANLNRKIDALVEIEKRDYLSKLTTLAEHPERMGMNAREADEALRAAGIYDPDAYRNLLARERGELLDLYAKDKDGKLLDPSMRAQITYLIKKQSFDDFTDMMEQAKNKRTNYNDPLSLMSHQDIMKWEGSKLFELPKGPRVQGFSDGMYDRMQSMEYARKRLTEGQTELCTDALIARIQDKDFRKDLSYFDAQYKSYMEERGRYDPVFRTENPTLPTVAFTDEEAAACKRLQDAGEAAEKRARDPNALAEHIKEKLGKAIDKTPQHSQTAGFGGYGMGYGNYAMPSGSALYLSTTTAEKEDNFALAKKLIGNKLPQNATEYDLRSLPSAEIERTKYYIVDLAKQQAVIDAEKSKTTPVSQPSSPAAPSAPAPYLTQDKPKTFDWINDMVKEAVQNVAGSVKSAPHNGSVTMSNAIPNKSVTASEKNPAAKNGTPTGI